MQLALSPAPLTSSLKKIKKGSLDQEFIKGQELLTLFALFLQSHY